MEIGLSHSHVICFGDQSSGIVTSECVGHIRQSCKVAIGLVAGPTRNARD